MLALVVVGLIVWSRTIQSRRGADLASIRTIAVLPMSTLPSAATSRGLSEGLTDELISTLGQLRSLTVKSGLFIKNAENRSDTDVARQLDVDALLKSTVSSQPSDGAGRSGRITVRADLIAAGSGRIVWTDRFERPLGEATALEADIVKAIADVLNLKVTPAESTRLGQVKRLNPPAEEAYFVARTHLDRYGVGSAQLALKAFDRALELDPSNASAHAGRAWAYISLGWNGVIANAAARANAMTAVREALKHDEGLAEAHTILGHANFIYEWDFAAAEQAFQRSLELNPSSAVTRTYYADFLEAMGRMDEAIDRKSVV